MGTKKSGTWVNKEAQLTSAEGGGKFQGICRNCKKRYVYKRKDYSHVKAKSDSGGECSNYGGDDESNKTCNHCKKKGHIDDNY